MIGSVDSTTRPLVKQIFAEHRPPPLPLHQFKHFSFKEGRNTWDMSPARRSKKVYLTRMNFPSTYVSWERSFYWGAGRNLSDNQQQTVLKSKYKRITLHAILALDLFQSLSQIYKKAWNEVLNAAHFKTEVANLYSKLRLRNNAIHYFD